MALMFSDISKAPSYARNYIVIGRLLGVAQGYPDGTFKPNNAATRAEALTFSVRALGVGLLLSAIGMFITYKLAVKKIEG